MKKVILVFLLLFTCSLTVKSEMLETVEGQVWATDYIIQDLMRKAPGRKLHKDKEERRRVSKLFVRYSNKHKIDVIRVTLQAFFESSLDWKRIGPDGEKGYLQVLPGGVLDNDCNLKTEEGGLDCGIKGLVLCRKKCKNWYGALMMYKMGKCETKKIHIIEKIIYRFKVWLKYHRKINDIEKEIEAAKIQEQEYQDSLNEADVPEYLKDEDTDVPLGWD